jgi:hypothetical protein
MPGLVGLEIGLAWSSTPLGWVPTPEVLARVIDGSPAARRLTQTQSSSSGSSSARLLPGRNGDERVERLLPCAPTIRSVVSLTRRLAEAMTDRRKASPAEASPARVERRSAPAREAEAFA